jgi:hypothetical protein
MLAGLCLMAALGNRQYLLYIKLVTEAELELDTLKKRIHSSKI